MGIFFNYSAALRSFIANAMFTASACAFALEVIDFGLLIYVWGFETPDKSASGFENAVVTGLSIWVIGSAAFFSASAVLTTFLGRVWPSRFALLSGVSLFAISHFAFLALSARQLQSAWLTALFSEKAPVFLVGLVAALLLAVGIRLITAGSPRNPQGG